VRFALDLGEGRLDLAADLSHNIGDGLLFALKILFHDSHYDASRVTIA
jgi:hypothetical protein